MRLFLLKRIMMEHIKERTNIVHNACQNEMALYEAYLKQIKSQYENMPTSQLESLARGMGISLGDTLSY